ncbi:Guanine nucleotide-binding protein, beta subunit [Melia azedarach]|uniref:Guanine nucleotide-binding protein, beta subunit n=1 Tax=Melia azedarach TaxID=155640 RepID=A0ACC1XPY5_MELAZ|nr:Guanine nucleotide-binding protein, beta subunit [Melia azedarach]
MILKKFSCVVFHYWVLSLLFFIVHGDGSEVSVKFLKTPNLFSCLKSATFLFEVLAGENVTCTDCSISCKLDDGIASDCGAWEVSYTHLQDGNHTFKVCGNRSQGVGCSSYNWIVDTIPPTAYVAASSSFTNALSVSVDISFTEPCSGGGGFGCASGKCLQPAGLWCWPSYTIFICHCETKPQVFPSQNSSFFVHFDRRRLLVDLRSHVPEKLLQLDSKTRTVQATNDYEKLKGVLVLLRTCSQFISRNSKFYNTSQGILIPINGENLGNRRFGFLVANISGIAIITISLNSNSIISRYGTPLSAIDPVTFLYDSQRPAVRLSTTSSTRTRQHYIPISIKFLKPVFGFNSSLISVSGGHLQSFEEIMKHYSVPTISYAISTFVTAAFLVTSFAAGLLTVSTASLLSAGAFSRPSYFRIYDPARNLLRTACYIQVFALSRWLAVMLPVEYYEFARGIQWSIPYFNLPWENGHIQPVMVRSNSLAGPHSYISKFHNLAIFQSEQPDAPNSNTAAAVYGSPLTPMEYRLFFESPNIKPEADYLDLHHLNGWRDFDRSMFCKEAMEHSHSQDLRIFLVILALPCVCKASTSLVKGGASSGVIVGILLLAVVSFLLLFLLLFLSVGITLGKLLQYKEVHQEGQICHWYQEIVRVTLGPGKRGQWTWKNQPNSVYLTILGPLFEDLRGPPKYMLSQISGGNHHKQGDQIIASDDETEDAEAPFIQKLFGILRIYYTLLESMKRVSLGILAGAYMDDWSSRAPTVILLCITSFQLLFMVLKKPFIKKRVQLVEIISVSCQVGLFTICLVLSVKEFSAGKETKVGIFMIILFLIGFFAEMINEWYALYRQAKLLDPSKNSFPTGLKVASFGLLLTILPKKLMKNLESKFPLDRSGDGVPVDTGSSVERNRSSGSRSSSSTDKPWLKQLRELAKSSFSKERIGGLTDPSGSGTKWSSFWSNKRSGSSSSDFRSKDSKPTGLYKDLEAIFAAK